MSCGEPVSRLSCPQNELQLGARRATLRWTDGWIVDGRESVLGDWAVSSPPQRHQYLLNVNQIINSGVQCGWISAQTIH